MEQSRTKIVPAKGAFWLREKSAPEQQNSAPELRESKKKIKRLFHGPVLFIFLRDAFRYKYKPCIR